MIIIRKALESDVQAIYTLRNRAIIEKCSGFYNSQQLALWTQGDISAVLINDIVDSFYVSLLNGKVIGCGKVNLETGMIDAIFVDPDYFGQGAAKLMLAFLERLALENDLELLTLESTLNAAGFYHACGFVGDEVSTYHSPRGISLDCIAMQKFL
ncbi:GNAT family N-acetyltransferase [Shewanella sp. MEBiC00475]|uniref:GNAT family N-acetyltransferase n=1 Tax=Shewanella sp. MEBiC00475 TaxID=2575361 RepID=UPI0010C07436|nr:GNAT family N-acetyltransferase [Shewanella sp. MEBiC00475]